MPAILVKLFFDKTDVATAFDAGKANLRKIVEMCIQTHILLQVMRGDVVTPHHPKIAFAITYDDIGPAFDQNPERVRIVCHIAKRRCSNTKTTLPPIVAKNADEPLMARESTDARITSKTASNGVLCERERLCPSRTMASAATNTMMPRSEIEQTSSFSAPRLSRAKFQKHSRVHS